MRTGDYKDLIKKYPNLYKNNVSFECYNGWFGIIHKLSKGLEKLVKESPECYAIQVKEKYGALRFYMSCQTDKMTDLIDKAEIDSIKTCEICGKKGVLMSKFRWLFTRCEIHKDV